MAYFALTFDHPTMGTIILGVVWPSLVLASSPTVSGSDAASGPEPL